MEFKIGEKVALIGGGCFRNEFFIVRYLGMKNESQANLETDGKSLPNPFTPFVTNSPKPLPMAGSTWSLAEIHDDIKDLPLGHYVFNSNEIIDITGIGVFGSILDGKVVKRFYPKPKADFEQYKRTEQKTL